MSITDELREEASGYAMYANTSAYAERLRAIADRIDAAHESAMYNMRREHDEWVADRDANWVKLPVDADGEYIHIGDEMEGVDKYDSLKKVRGKVITISFESDGIVDVAIQAWSSDGKSWHRAYLDPDASVYRHYHAPTVEDVLRELVAAYMDTPLDDLNEDEFFAKYAGKLRLAEVDG